MKPIQTEYKGYRFRSRLEARWAVFFDKIGIKWQYEPEGFVLKSGKKYLPDFYLPDVSHRSSPGNGVYIEIKPTVKSINSLNLAEFEHSLFAFHGLPPGIDDDDGGYELAPIGWDNCMLFMMCVDCGHVKIEYSEGNYMECPRCGGRVTTTCPGCGRRRIIEEPFLSAQMAARSARFEHGEHGAA
jgi:ribosomal protein S27E